MSKYCVTVDGAGVGKIYPNTCPPPPKAGEPTPFTYIIGPAATDKGAQPNCATTDPSSGIQSFKSGACATEGPNSFTFYSYQTPVSGQPQLCFQPTTFPDLIPGTVITNVPKTQTCELNLNVAYQNLTCNETGCGDHGTCQNNVCVCSDFWTGAQCEFPPTGNAACVPDTDTKKSCGNQGTYGVCQSSVNPQNGIAGSGQCACDTLNSQSGTFCEKACESDNPEACGGPLRGVCVDTMYKFFTNNNAVSNRCACLNGWSGFNCNIPPPGWQCNATDKQCTNITTLDPTQTVQTGDCNSGTCLCKFTPNDCSQPPDPGSKPPPGYTGTACQNQLAAKGAPCSDKEPCTLPGQICNNGVCICNGDSPDPSANFLLSIVEGLLGPLTSAKGLEAIGIILAVHNWKKLLQLVKWMSTKLLLPAFKSGIFARLTAAAGGKEMTEGAVRTLEESIGKSLAAKLMAKMSMVTLLKSSVKKISEETAVIAFKAVFGSVFGAVSSFVDMAGLLGMILDASDIAGLKEKMTQDSIDAMMLKFTGSVNSVKAVQDAGILYPQKIIAQDTFPFALLHSTQATKDKFGTDVGDYLGHLTVNSNGDAIIPTFNTKQQQDQSAAIAAAQGDILYAVAGYNLTVYNRLKQDWPIIVAATLVIIGALIGAGFGIKALVNKKKVLKNQ